MPSLDAVTCIIRAMPTGDSDGCRPPVPDHADHLFRWQGVRFFRDTGIGGRYARNAWTISSEYAQNAQKRVMEA